MARRLQTYQSETLTVTFAAERCIHAAECVRRVPRVFAPRARPWIRLEQGDADAIAAAVAACPTGALQLRWTEGSTPAQATAPDAPAKLRILLQRDGPLFVRGAVQLVDEKTGDVIASDDRVALCRCGGTRNPPFCDGTHATNGFRSTPRETSGPAAARDGDE